MNKERLAALATFLLTVPEHKFDLSSWRIGDEGSESGPLVTDAKLRSTACGTTGCAIGWACAMPKFKAQGLLWDYSQPIFEDASVGGHYSGWVAVEAFFDLTNAQAHRLYDDRSYSPTERTTPKEVSARITELISQD